VIQTKWTNFEAVVFQSTFIFLLELKYCFLLFHARVPPPTGWGLAQRRKGAKGQSGKGSLPRLGVAEGKQRDNLKKLAI